MKGSPLLEEVKETIGTLREHVDEALRALKNDDMTAFRQNVEEAEGWAEAVLEDLEKVREIAVEAESPAPKRVAKAGGRKR